MLTEARCVALLLKALKSGVGWPAHLDGQGYGN